MSVEPTSKTAGPARAFVLPTGSVCYEICLVGGTKIRITPGRGKDKAYDLLLAALKDSKSLNDDGKWQDEWMMSARSMKADEFPPAQLTIPGCPMVTQNTKLTGPKGPV